MGRALLCASGIEMIFVLEWAKYFALTLVVELAVCLPLLGSRYPLGRRVAAVVFAQLASHPAVWFILPLLGLGRSPYLVIAESWAVLSELLLYRLVFVSLPWIRALGIASLANGASFAVGLLLR